MDETLNRPLFRHKAQIVYKRVQGLQIGGPPLDPFSLEGIQQSIRTRLSPGPAVAPAPQPRGLGALFMDVGPGKALKYGKKVLGASKTGLQAFQAARAARNLPPSRYEQFATKYPKITGSLLTGLGGGSTAVGGYDVYEGIREGDISKIAEGGAGIFLGSPIARSGISRFKTGKPKYDSLTKETLPGVGLYGASMVLPENEVKRELDKRVKIYESTTGQKATPEQIKKAELVVIEEVNSKKSQQPQTALDRAFPGLSNAEIIEGRQPKTTLDIAFPGLSNVDIIEGKGRQDPVNLFSDVSKNIVQQSNDIKGVPPTGLSREEIAVTLDNDEGKRKSGADLVKQANKEAKTGNSFAQRFKTFEKEYNEAIGGSREISDLVLYKLATGLLTGTTTKSGFAGFADVLGKAGGDVIDTAILLASKEKDRKAGLMEAFYKAEKADKSDAVTTERYTTVIPDPSGYNGMRVEERARFKETGLDAKAVPSNEIDPTTGIRLPYWVAAEYNPNAVETKKDPGKLDERRAALNSTANSYRMADAIARQDPGTLGAPGSIKLFKEKIIGSISGILENEITPSKYNGDTDEYINNEILGQGVRKADGTFISAKDAIAEKEKLINEIVEKRTKSKFFQRPSPNELEKLVKNVRYETNFAYAYANSLKAEDRLTEKNLEDAKKVSKIFGLESPTKIIEQFKQLADDADKKFAEETKRYQLQGGNSAFFDQNFTFMPSYQKEKNRIGGMQRRQEIQQNLMKGVETLPDKYK